MYRVVLSLVLSAIFSGGALAGDLAPPPPPLPSHGVTVGPVEYDWAGIYLGLNGGYGVGGSTWSTIGFTRPLDMSGFFGGGTVGVNFQIRRFVVGVETDLDWSDINSSIGTSCASAAILTCETKNTWLGTTRGRAGYAIDRAFLYLTGGAAYGNVQAVANSVTNSTTKIGWTAGAGVEVAITEWNWTAKVEYLFVDLGNGSCSTACTVPSGLAFNLGYTESLVRAGLNYKFSF